MIKKLFICTVILGLIVNLFSDMAVFTQSKTAISTGEWVNHSYQVSQLIEQVRSALLESRLKKEPVHQLAEKIQILSSMNHDLPSQKLLANSLARFSVEELTTTQSNTALEILSKLEAAEDALMAVRLQEDEKSNASAMARVLYANIFDVFLLLLLGSFFFYERHHSLKLQKALAKTLVDVDANNQNLQFALAQKNAQLKTTIHDLKNPLGSIRGFAELISNEAGNRDSILEMAQVIQRVSNNSLALVGQLLSEDSEDKIIQEPVQVLACLEEACAFLGPIASEKNQKIKLSHQAKEFYLLGHKHQIQDVFLNIVGNALKFSPAGSAIFVESVDENGFHEIRVKDEGPGFAEEDFSKLFTQGSKLSAKPTGQEVSTGLGLYSAKQTIDRFGGTIHADKTVKRGACMKIRFPDNKSVSN